MSLVNVLSLRYPVVVEMGGTETCSVRTLEWIGLRVRVEVVHDTMVIGEA